MNLRFPASLNVTVPLILLAFAATLSTVNILYHVPQAERSAVEDSRKRLAQDDQIRLWFACMVVLRAHINRSFDTDREVSKNRPEPVINQSKSYLMRPQLPHFVDQLPFDEFEAFPFEESGLLHPLDFRARPQLSPRHREGGQHGGFLECYGHNSIVAGDLVIAETHPPREVRDRARPAARRTPRRSRCVSTGTRRLVAHDGQ